MPSSNSPKLLKDFGLVVLSAAAALSTWSSIQGSDENAPAECFVYVGTYSQEPGEGICRLTLDLQRGTLSEPQPAASVAQPAFLVLHPAGSFLFATCRVLDADGQPAGGVAAFAIDRTTGNLRELNRMPSGGTGPCHLAVDQFGKCVLVANCGNARVACLAIQEDGSLKSPASVIQHEGISVNSQEGPQAHSINVDPSNRFAFAADLGLDRVFAYRLDPAAATLAPHTPACTKVSSGAGPRHFAFHPDGKFAYVINELGNTVTAFSFDGDSGTLHPIQEVATLPADFAGESFAAEVQLHPTGKFLYGSNRGHDSIALFAVDSDSGRLTSLGQEPARGRTPRHFAIDPAGRFLVVANQKSDHLVVFRVDSETGRLEAAGEPVSVPQPVCVRLLARP